jgi:hypothetical protein
MANKGHHRDPRYRKLAPIITAAAYANPDTRCWRPDCRLTLAEVRATNPQAKWTAGHMRDGILDTNDPMLGLRAECSPCNFGKGAEAGNGRRWGGYAW